MELWPENDPVTRLKHTGIVISGILFLATLSLAKYLESFPAFMELPLSARASSSAYFLGCLLVLFVLCVRYLSENNSRRKTQYGFTVWGVFIFAWLVWIGLKLINIKADSSTPRDIQVLVVGKHVSSGKGGSSEYLDVEPTGERKRYRFRVSSNIYFKTDVNDTLRVSIKQGYFNDPWVMSHKNMSQSL